jgi:hypothetical protein
MSRQGKHAEQQGEIAEKGKDVQGKHDVKMGGLEAEEAAQRAGLGDLLLGQAFTVSAGIEDLIEKMAFVFVILFGGQCETSFRLVKASVF